MLVLTRKSGETVRIGNNITVSVLQNSHGQVKLGVSAPQDISIYREEVYIRIKRENAAAMVNGQSWPEILKHLPVESK